MDSRRNASIAISRDCECSPPSNTWDSFALVAHSGGATNISPLSKEEEKKGNVDLPSYNTSVPKDVAYGT